MEGSGQIVLTAPRKFDGLGEVRDRSKILCKQG